MTTENKEVKVTEDDLLKSIKALETPKEEPKVETTTTIETVKLMKAVDAIKDGLSKDSQAALDVSPILREITAHLAKHVDNSLEALQKSVTGSAERDLAFATVLTDLVKSVKGLQEIVATFGKEAGAPKTVTVQPTEILTKNVDGKPKTATEVNPAAVRKQVADGLEILAKKYNPGTQESMRYLNAAVRYESTGQIDDGMLAEVQGVYKK